MAEFQNQTQLREQVIQALLPMIPELEKWKSVWKEIPKEKQLDWLIEGKSMFLSAAAGTFIYLYPFFENILSDIQSGNIILNLETMILRRPEDMVEEEIEEIIEEPIA
jgi:hypothetical protein